jgi:hypothetical protein
MILDAIQRHEIARDLALPSRASILHRELRNALVRASNAGKLRTPPSAIHQTVQLLPEPPPQLGEDLRQRDPRTRMRTRGPTWD